MIVLGQGVHFFDGGLQRSAGFLFFYQPTGIGGHGSGFPVHNINFSCDRSQRKRIVTVSRWSAQDVMRCRRALAEHDQHHGDIRLLDGVDQRLTQAKQLGLFRQVTDIDPGCVLKPDDRNAVPPAEGYEFVQF